ncbi:MAG: FixH family protein [Gammaproteobacteria bacterium]|nr:FixH family protein [Gammaproteobacteria bacterium]
MTDSRKHGQQDRDDGPWYKQFWAWFVLAPLLLVMLAWIPFMTIIVKDADDMVVDNYYKEGRMYNMRLEQDRAAAELGLAGELLVDLAVGEVVLSLASSASDYRLPEQLTLYLDHPLEEDNDLRILLRQAYPGRYLGDLPHRIQHRWYVRLASTGDAMAPGQTPAAARTWRLTGELNLDRATRLKFGGDE